VALLVIALPGLTPRPLAAQAADAADRRSAQEVRALFEAFNAAWERRDPAFIDTYYAHDPDGVFFFERRQLLGWPKVDSLYQAMFASAARGEVDSRFDVLDVGARGDLAWVAANFRLEVVAPAGGTTVDEGRQTVVFERRDGRWVVVHRHTSFQAPPGPQRHVPLQTGAGPLWSPADDPTGGPDAVSIRRLRESFNDAIAAHDLLGIEAVLAEDVVVVSSTSAVTRGRGAYLARLGEQFLTRPDVVYRRTPDEVGVFAPWAQASESGTWVGSWTEPDGEVAIAGRYFAKWKRVDGAWKVASETYVPERCAGSAYCARVP
jgi:uncharacterized protein (TIGR02246 family)